MFKRNYHQKHRQEEDKKLKAKNKFIEFNNLLKKIQCFSQISLRDLIGPDGYADNIAYYFTKGIRKNEKVNISQLRKFFSEIKEISKIGEVKPEKAQKRIWFLYPIIAYAEGRKVIPEDFATMLTQVLEKVEGNNCNKPEDYKRLGDFMTALVAYFKKYNPNG